MASSRKTHGNPKILEKFYESATRCVGGVAGGRRPPGVAWMLTRWNYVYRYIIFTNYLGGDLQQNRASAGGLAVSELSHRRCVGI